MDVFEAIEGRRSIRKYKKKPVPDDLLDKVLEAARIAPSTSNTQSWRFKVVTDPAVRKRIRDVAYGQRFVEEAPVVIACCLDFSAFKERGRQTLKLVLRGVRPSLEMVLRSVRGNKDKDFDPERVVINGTMNVTIAVEHMILEAQSLGLGTCWVRAFDPPAVSEILDLPEGMVIVNLLTLGYPDQKPAARPRKKLEEILL
ncbi:MAG TPA: nitroreductase family protein [Candidatus Anoxymicrobiaceae bacterium]|jgi:nitroreductase